MTLQSTLYLVFLPAVWLVVLALRRPKARQCGLLLASYFFYAMWSPLFLLLLVATSLFNFFFAERLRRKAEAGVLWTGLGVNLLLLGSLKYLPSILGSAGVASPPLVSLFAAVGLSFYTFQAMSYLLDIFRCDDEVRPTLIEFLLYMAFFPTVLAGPICRVGEMVPQFRAMQQPGWDDVATGARRIILGLFMKIVVADMMGYGIASSEGVNTGFDALAGGWSGMDAWFLAIGFGFQLFFDFAGYSNLAIGSARLFGIRVRENFNAPYLSCTPAEFWTRWHISLSLWIRDYLFFPLATARRELWWRNLALVLAMAVFGLWHGAALTFILWGVYQGILLVAHRVIQRVWPPAEREAGAVAKVAMAAASWAATFFPVSLGWLLFRAGSLKQALAMLAAAVTPAGFFRHTMRPNFYVLVLMVVAGYFLTVALGALAVRAQRYPALGRALWLASPVLYSAMIVAIIVWTRQSSTFVYFQF